MIPAVALGHHRPYNNIKVYLKQANTTLRVDTYYDWSQGIERLNLLNSYNLATVTILPIPKGVTYPDVIVWPPPQGAGV